jgi:phosphoribosylformylglycinamidine synthase subunit PurL
VFWQLKESVEGMADACRQLELPVVSGNVSLYNDTSGVSVWPTPVVGMVGLIDDVSQVCRAGFRTSGDLVLLLGRTLMELQGSEYARTIAGQVAGKPPALDLALERRTWRAVLAMIREGALESAHDVADGGLAVAVAESCLFGGIGANCDRLAAEGLGPAALLFSESQSRFVLSCAPGALERLEDIAREHDVEVAVIGVVGGDRISIGGGWIDETLEAVRQRWDSALA